MSDLDDHEQTRREPEELGRLFLERANARNVDGLVASTSLKGCSLS